MSPQESADRPLDVTSPAAQQEATDQGAAEKSTEVAASAPDQREKALSTATTSMHNEVAAKQVDLTAAGRSLDAPTQSYLEQYFQSAIHRFDADKDGKISEQESGEFKKSMLEKTNEIIGGMIEGAKAEQKIEKAAEKAEKIDTTKAENSLKSVQALGDLTDLQQANGELQKIQSQNEAFQQTVQTQLGEVQKFSATFNEFQQAQEGFGHFAQLWDAVVNSTERGMAIASMKASLETTRGAVDSMLTALKDKQKTLDANGEKIKAAFTKARQDIIKAREEKKAEVKKAKTEQVDQIKARKEEYNRLQVEKKKLEERREQIAERQATSKKIREDWHQENEAAKIKTQKENCNHEKGDIQAELAGFRLILGNPDVPPSVKDSIRKDYEAAKVRQQKNKLALEVIDLKKKSGVEFIQNLDKDQETAARELQSADAHLARQRATGLSLQQNIDMLDGLQLQYATESNQVDKYYNGQIEILDKQTESVDDFMLNSSMARQQSIRALAQAKTSLEGLSVEAKGFWHFMNPLEVVGSLSKGIGGALYSAAQSIDGWTRDVLNVTRKSDSTWDQVIYYGVQFGSVFSGFVSGGLELGGGIFTLAGGLVSDIGSIGTALMSWDSKKMHFETFAGLGAIIGYDAAKGEFSWDKVGDTWGAMGKSIIGYGENWGTHIDPITGKEEQRDEYGTAIGKSVFNVLSMFVGVGAAGVAAKGGATAARVGARVGMLGKAGLAANVARHAAIEAAKAAGKSAGMLTGRGAQMLAFAKSLTQSLRPAALAEATKAARIAPGGRATQAAAFGRSIASSALDTTAAAGRTVGRGLGSARQAAGRGMRGLREAWQHPWRTAGRAAIGAVKGVGWALKTGAKITYEIAMMPYRLTWGFGKAVGNFGRGGTGRAALLAARSSRRVGAAAEVMQRYGDDYAKAQQSLRRIIDEDPVLSKKALEIENAGLSPEIAAQRHLALEAEATQKLVKTDPGLAEAYLGFRRASNQLVEEAEGYLAATRKEAGRVTKNPEMRTAFEEYERLRAEAKNGTKEAWAALKEFEADPVRMDNARGYRDAKAAQAELAALRTQIDDLRQGVVSQYSDDASRLADEINEARAVHAPDDAPAAGTALTDTPAFAREFRRDFDRAYSAKNYQAVEELVDSLGTYRDGRLAEVLEGFRRRRELAIPDEPALASRVTDKWRQQLVDELDQAHVSGKFNSYQTFRDRYYGRSAALDKYIDWVEDIYKKHPAEARGLVFYGERDFSAALKANQKVSLDLFEEWSQKITDARPITELRAEMQAANLPTQWQAALEQMHQRLTLRNRQTALAADAALNRIRAEYASVVRPEMTAAEAAQRLEKVYGHEGLGQSAARRPGIREVATDIRLKDGVYTLQVADDGFVRLIDGKGHHVLPKGPSAPATAPAAASATPAPAATPASAPAVAPAASAPATPPRLSAAMRGLESREARLQSAIDHNAGWQDLAAQGDAGLLIARSRARIADYRSRIETFHLEKRLKGLEDDLQKAKNAGNSAKIQKAEAALDTLKKEPAYLEYQSYQKTENLVNKAEGLFNKDNNPGVLLRAAQRNLVQDDLMGRLNTKLTAEEAAALLERERIPATRKQFNEDIDIGKIKLKGGKEYSVKMMKNGEFSLFDESGQVIRPAATPAPAAAPTAGAAPAAAPKAAPSQGSVSVPDGMSVRPAATGEAPIYRNDVPRRIGEVPRQYEVAAVGDLHGNIHAMEGNLKKLKLVDEGADFMRLDTVHWRGGDRKVVLHGDILGDRIANGIDSLRAIRKLRQEARAQGGDVIYLAGNHETFVLDYLLKRKQQWGDFNQVQGIGEFSRGWRGDGTSSILENMRKDISKGGGREILEEMCEMRLAEYIDDTLYLHTELTPAIVRRLETGGKSIGEAVDSINADFQAGLRHELLGEGTAVQNFDDLVNTFTHTNNRDFAVAALPNGQFAGQASLSGLRQKGVNRVLHGHTDLTTIEDLGQAHPVLKGKASYLVDDIEITSMDRSAGKGGEKLAGDEAAAAYIDRNGQFTFGSAPEVAQPMVAAPTPAPAATRTASAPAATPAAAKAAPTTTPAIPRKTPAERMREAVSTREQALRDLGRGRARVLQLEERIPQLEQRIEAMEVRGASGPRLKAARESLLSLQDELERINVSIAENAEKVWATRGDYWKARLLQKGQAIRETVGVQRRIDWLKGKSRTLGTMAEKGVNILSNPAKNLWESLKKQVDSTLPLGEGTTAEFSKMYLFARAGMEVTNRLEALQAAAAPRLPAALPILAELRRDQYNILAEIQKDADRSLGLPGEEEFDAMSAQEQTAALGAAYGRLEGGGRLPEEGLVYSEAQKQYIGEKKQLARQALAGVSGEGNELTPETVTAALDNAFGPQGLNDSRVDYQIEVEGLKIKVDKEGNRTYEGVEGWVAAAPARKILRAVFGEIEQSHSAMTPSELAKAAPDKGVSDSQGFGQYLGDSIAKTVGDRRGDSALPTGAVFESPTLTEAGEPIFSARVKDDGKLEVTVDPAWARATYDGIRARPDQPTPARPSEAAPGRVATPRGAPRRAPESPDESNDKSFA